MCAVRNNGFAGTDMLNGAWNYPNATTQERNTIRKAHIDYVTGLLWFWATDPASGDAVQQEMATLGHCNDEYLNGNEDDPPHWPYQLYVYMLRLPSPLHIHCTHLKYYTVPPEALLF